MMTFKEFFLFFLWIYTGHICLGCDSSDPVLKVDLNGAWKLHIQSRHTIQNIVVSHGRFVNCFIINSNETPHILDRRFENRIKITRSSLGNALDILVTNATSEDGGTYSVHVTTDHVTFTKCYSLYVMGRPTAPVISLRGTSSSMVKDGGFVRFICTSHSTTIPRNPDWPLHYMFSFNGVNITDMTAETRYMAKDNELIIANLSKKDLPLEITCNVWEEDGLSSVHTSNFKLHVIEEIRYDGSDRYTHAQQRKSSGTQGIFRGRHHTALTLVGLVMTILARYFGFPLQL